MVKYVTKVKKNIENIDINYDFKTILKNNLEIIEITNSQIVKCVLAIVIILLMLIFSGIKEKIILIGLILFVLIDYIAIEMYWFLQNQIKITANDVELIIKEHKKVRIIQFCNLISVKDNLDDDIDFYGDKELVIKYIKDGQIATYTKKIFERKPNRIYMIEEDVKKLTESFINNDDLINKSEEELEQYRDIERNFNIEDKLEKIEKINKEKIKKNKKNTKRIFIIYFIIFIAILGYAVYIRIRQYI